MTKYIWNNPDIPHKGWTCVKVVDTGNANSKCKMCGNGTVRYLHFLEHDDYESQLQVGSECSMKMAKNYSTASYVEDYIKRYPKEQEKWPSKWKMSQKGNPYYLEEDYPRERLVTIFPDRYKPGQYKYSIIEKEFTTTFNEDGPEQETYTDKKFSQKSFSTITEAQEDVFNEFYPNIDEYNRLLNEMNR